MANILLLNGYISAATYYLSIFNVKYLNTPFILLFTKTYHLFFSTCITDIVIY